MDRERDRQTNMEREEWGWLWGKFMHVGVYKSNRVWAQDVMSSDSDCLFSDLSTGKQFSTFRVCPSKGYPKPVPLSCLSFLFPSSLCSLLCFGLKECQLRSLHCFFLFFFSFCLTNQSPWSELCDILHSFILTSKFRAIFTVCDIIRRS